MGFKQIELTPINVTAATPTSKFLSTKVFALTRLNTVNAVRAIVPKGSFITDIKVIPRVVSNAGTTGAVTVTVNGVTALVADTQTATIKSMTASNTAGMFTPEDLGSSILNLNISAVYAETGTASTTGSFLVLVEYVA